MIRLFAPPTSDTVFRRGAVTAGNFLAHAALVVLLAIPIATAVNKGLLDHLVVFLVPPDKPAGLEHSLDTAPVTTVATDAGRGPHGAVAVTEAAADEEKAPVSRGEVPVLSSANLDAAAHPLPSDNALTELQVDSTVIRDPTSAAPEYPPVLLAKGIEGMAAVLYVVDTLGVVDLQTYRAVSATHPDFVLAVRVALPEMKFRPAVQQGRRVRQLVHQTFRFRITPSDTFPTRPPPKPPA